MSAQIIPFQTKEQRTLASAFAHYQFIKGDCVCSGGSEDRESIIRAAVYGAVANERWGVGWEDDTEVKKAMRRETSDRLRAIWDRSAYWEFEYWDQYSQRLEWLLARWLDGKLQRLRQRKPLRPPRRKFKSESPLAQIITFPVPHVRTKAPEAIDSVPAFWVFCDSQNRRADEMGTPRPLYADLVERYRNGERYRHGERV